MNNIPKKTTAVILPDYNRNLIRAIIGMKIGERDLPELKGDEVLVEMKAAPCNPSDIAFIRGGYNIIKEVPAVPGFEGAGVVVAIGKNAQKLIGKRVSSFTQEEHDGTWAEYFIAHKKDCIVLLDDLNFEQGACLSINPFTAWGLVEIAKQKNAKALVQNASGGQVADFIRKLAKLNGIEIIDIVRKEEHIEVLKGKGTQHVLDSSKENFKEYLKSICHELKAGIAFDAVGGEMTGMLLNALPEKSDVVLYGGLAGGSVQELNPFNIIFQGKKLYGFNLNEWIKEIGKEEFEKINQEIQDLIINGKLKTEIQATFKLNDVVEGVRTYIKSMSGGKVLFTS